MTKPQSLRVRLALSTAMAGAVLVGHSGRDAEAGTCTDLGGGVYFCSGGAVVGENGVDIDFGGPVTVTTSSAPPAGFGIDTTGKGETAISIKADGGLSFDDTNTFGSSITGAIDGIYAKNENGGALTITTNGPVVGIDGTGIDAENDADGTDLTISAASVSGEEDGIDAFNKGTGALSIMASGAVTGEDGDGIRAINFDPNSTDLTISSAAVSGGSDGIAAGNFGTGALSITATGAVTGENDGGIFARNSAAGTDLTISAAAVSGRINGIEADSQGTGDLSVSASGTITGTTDDGILANNSANGTGLTISAAGVRGGSHGIGASNSGSGSLSITAGNVTGGLGGNGDGIIASLGSDGDDLTISAAAVIGADTGIVATNAGSGALSITASGLASGASEYGISAKIDNAASGADLTVSAAGVTGAVIGILADHQGSGDIAITADDPVEGTSDYGIKIVNTAIGGAVTITADDVTGGKTGILAEHLGTGALSITADGTVTGGTAQGILGKIDNAASGADLTVSAMDVNGGRSGIRATNAGTGALSITAGGTVTGGTTEGIFAKIDNAASGADLTISAMGVSGGTDGIDAKNLGAGNVIVTTSGPVTGDGNGYGIRVGNFVDGSVSVTANDTVSATGGTGIAARNYGAGTDNVTISAAGISGRTGISASNAGSGTLFISASGTVTGTHPAGGGISASNSGTDLTISVAGVSGGSRGISAINSGTGTLSITATGTVTSGSSLGIGATNQNGGGIIVAAKDVVAGGDGISVTNNPGTTDTTITAASVTGGGTGILARSRGTGDVSVTAAGAVSGAGSFGISANLSSGGGGMTISTDDVFGGGGGIRANNSGDGALTVTAKGTVTGNTGDGISAELGMDGSDLTISAFGVSGANYGILAENGGAGDLVITTSGAVTGIADTGIAARNLAGGAVNITTGDTVSGDNFGLFSYNSADGTSMTVSADGVDGGAIGMYARHLGSGDLNISSSGLVTGTGYAGIFALNEGSGALSITASDTVSGPLGIKAENYAGSTSLIISAVDVNAGVSGINARNKGSGDLIITATGPVTTTTGAAIFGRNYAGGALSIDAADTVSGNTGVIALTDVGTSSVTISIADVDGGNIAIYAKNLGAGDLSITASGPVTSGANAAISARNYNGGDVIVTAEDTVSSTSGTGIVAFNDAGGSDLTISVMGVSGTSGIDATNDGSGELDIAATGPIAGGSGYGIVARNYNAGGVSITAKETVSSATMDGIRARSDIGGTDVTVDVAGVSGAVRGIDVRNRGTGDISITATGMVAGGLRQGIIARNLYGGDLSITTTDTVASASWDGIFAYSGAGGGDITISVNNVSGDDVGIEVENLGDGDFGIAVDGAVSGNTGPGIDITDPNMMGGLIVIDDTGSVQSTGGAAIDDDDGSVLVISRGALAGDVLMNGGEDEVELVDGSATGLLGLGGNDDTLEIFGAGAGGGWDDADFSGTFDNNLGLTLQIDGGDGLDTAELFGVTAASQALGVPIGLEALALSDNTLLQANDADLTPFGALFVDPTSTLQAEGNSPSDTVVGSLGNEGVVDLADGEANDTLTVEGDYAGAAGSQVWLDLDVDGEASDTLFILGDVTDVAVGPFAVTHDRTALNMTPTGRGGRARGNGIQLISVSGAVDEDDFFLTGPVEAGIFDYELIFEDGEFLLRSDFFEQIYAYESLPGAMQTIGLALTGQLVERVGVRSGAASTLAGADGNPVAGGQPVDTALWARAVGLSVESEGDLDSATGGSFEQTVGFIQGGGEVVVSEGASGRLLVGALGHWGTSSQDLTDIDGGAAGSTDFDFYGGGLTATWYGTGGLYVDGVVQYTAYDIDINPISRFSSVSTDGYGIAASGEVGYRIALSDTAALVPQAQLTYQHLDFDDFVDPDGVRIALNDGDSLTGRLGVAFENSAAIGSSLVTGYVEANLLHEFLGDNSVTASALGESFALNQDLGGTSVELGFGGTVAVSRGVSLYAEVDYTIPLDNGVQGFQALGGIRVNLNPPPPPPMPVPVIAPVAETAFIVFFDWDRATLTPEANLVLDDMVIVANQSGYASVRLDGYTDLSGSPAYNLGLSERRANSVADGLIARGIAPDEIVIRAFGEENPLVPTPDGVREPQNRRVEIFLS